MHIVAHHAEIGRFARLSAGNQAHFRRYGVIVVCCVFKRERSRRLVAERHVFVFHSEDDSGFPRRGSNLDLRFEIHYVFKPFARRHFQRGNEFIRRGKPEIRIVHYVSAVFIQFSVLRNARGIEHVRVRKIAFENRRSVFFSEGEIIDHDIAFEINVRVMSLLGQGAKFVENATLRVIGVFVRQRFFIDD